MAKGTVKIKDIDFTMLKKQKEILLNMMYDWEKSGDEQKKSDSKEAEGLLNLIDAIQDEAVKELGLDEKEVFNIED